MGRNSWNRNRDKDRNDKNRTSSIEPLWKKRKVIGARDMDAWDDDVNFTRLASRASPPPPDPPPPESKFKPFIKQEGKPRPGDIGIFSKINQSQPWDWSQKGSNFLEESPERLNLIKSEPDSIPGFGSSNYDVPDVKPPLQSRLQKMDLPSAVGAIKQELRDESPPLSKYISCLDLVNTDDEDDYLYGDAVDGNKNSEKDLSSKSKQLSEDGVSAREGNRPESSSDQGIDSHAALEGYLKRMGVNNKSPAVTASSTSEGAQQRAHEIAKRVTEMFNTPRPDSTPIPEVKRRDPRLRAKSNQASDSNAPQLQSALPPQPASYEHAFSGRTPVMIPGLMPLTTQLPVATSPYPGNGQDLQHFPMPPNSPFPLVQSFPPLPKSSYLPPTPAQTTTIQPLASRSNLKGIDLQGEGTIAGSGMSSKAVITASVPGPKVEEVKTPTNLMERKKLLQVRLETKKKLEILNSQVEDCRKRQGELMRKKQQQKGGQKDPHLTKVVAAQELYNVQLKHAKKKLEDIDKALKRCEFLARKPSESPPAAATSSLASATNSVSGISAESAPAPKEICNGKTKESAKSKSSSQTTSTQDKYRYVDNGNHWCKHCHEIFKLATDLLKHLHSKHLNVIESLAPAERPWASKPQEYISASANLILQPFQGVEFMVPSPAFYCSLCCEFSGDHFEARNHLESEKHNYNHSKYCLSNPSYLRRVQTELVSSLARKKEEIRHKLIEAQKDNKRKIEESLKDRHQSRHSKSASSSRRKHSLESGLNRGDDDPSKKSEENNDCSCTISSPQSKIPFKSVGKGVSTSLTLAKASKEPVPLLVEDKKTQHVLSNLKKKRIQDKSERSESLPLEDVISIALESGFPSDSKLPEKGAQSVAKLPTGEVILQPPSSHLGEGKIPESLLLAVENFQKRHMANSICQPLSLISSKKGKSRSSPVVNLDTQNLANLSEILDAIPLPQELDELAKKIEDNMAKESVMTADIEDVEMQDVEESGKPKESSTISADSNSMPLAPKDVGDDKQSDDFHKVPGDCVDINFDNSASNVMESEKSNDAFTLVIDNVTSLSNFDNSEILPIGNDVEMTESTNHSTQGVEAQAAHESMSQHDVQSTVSVIQEHEPKMDESVKQDGCSAIGDAVVHSSSITRDMYNTIPPIAGASRNVSAVTPQASRPISNRSSHLPEKDHSERSKSTDDTNCCSDVSTDEYEDLTNAEQLQLAGSVPALTKSLSLQDGKETAALINGRPEDINAGGNTVRKYPQLAICSRGRGRGKGGARSLPSCSVVVKQEIFDSNQLQMSSEKSNSAKGASSSGNQFIMVIKQEPMSPPKDHTDTVAMTTLCSVVKKGAQTTHEQDGKVSKSNVRVKQEPGVGDYAPPESEEEAELSHPMAYLQNLESSIMAGDNMSPCMSTPTKKMVKDDAGEASASEKKLDDALLEDEDTVGLPPVALEGEEKLDDALLNDPESMTRFDLAAI